MAWGVTLTDFRNLGDDFRLVEAYLAAFHEICFEESSAVDPAEGILEAYLETYLVACPS